MGLLDPAPTPYDPLEWYEKPFAERARLVCEAWAMQGYGAPLSIYVIYLLKVGFYVGMWVWFCSFSPELGGLGSIGDWWLEPAAFQKAIVWSMLFEILGFGCGSGPLTARYNPPIGGALYFLRPGTTKAPLVEGAPVIGGYRRGLLDVALYAATLGVLGWALVSPELLDEQLLALVVLVPLMGLFDRTLFLAARAEHYWVVVVCFAFAGNWIAGAKSVQLALWFWAGVSKLNRHFPTVVAVMTSNSPVTRMKWFRRMMYQSYPDDLRPSRLAEIMAHMGSGLEFAVPIVMVAACFVGGGPVLIAGMVLMLMLHGYITSNVPMGVPIEWNVLVVYGGFALFWAHPEVTPLDLGEPLLAVFLLIMLVALPLIGNLVPKAVSFLISMRYYAGNWPVSVWMIHKDAGAKLERLTRSSGPIMEQLAILYDEPTAKGLGSRVLSFRLMHLHGRALPLLLSKAVDRFEDYEYNEGEVFCGQVIGWNFGDGHLHDERLVRAVQSQCAFEPGELRVVIMEAQPLLRQSLRWRIVDGAEGELERGEIRVDELCSHQPWEVAPGEPVRFANELREAQVSADEAGASEAAQP